MIYPSRRAVWLGAAGALPVLLVALARPEAWYLGLLWICLLLALLLVDAAAGAPGSALSSRVTSQPQVPVGGEFALELEARFEGSPPRRLELRVGHDARVAPSGAAGGTLALDGGVGRLALDFRAVRRGLAGFDRLWLRWTGPFGLAMRQVVHPLDHAVAVLPALDRVRDQAIALLQRDALAGERPQFQTGGGHEFEALVEYQPGMARRMIDWKRSARHGKLLVREQRAERNNAVVFAVDCGRLMCEPLDGLPKMDRAVAAALLNAFVALRGGDQVGLFGFDSRPRLASGTVRGAGSFDQLQRLAARLDYSTEETNYTLALLTLAGRLERRSLVVVFTDFVDPTSAELMLRTVGRLAERHLVIFALMKDAELEALADRRPERAEDVARAVTAGALLRERRVVVGRLRQLGAHVLEADHRALGPALVERYLAIKRESLL